MKIEQRNSRAKIYSEVDKETELFITNIFENALPFGHRNKILTDINEKRGEIYNNTISYFFDFAELTIELWPINNKILIWENGSESRIVENPRHVFLLRMMGILEK